MLVLEAQGVEGETELPFAGLSQLIAPVLDHISELPAPQQRALRGRWGSAPTVRRSASPPTSRRSGSRPGRRERPLLALVDDAHWLDTASIEALTFAARRLSSEPAALLLASRPPGLPDALECASVEGLMPPPPRRSSTA